MLQIYYVNNKDALNNAISSQGMGGTFFIEKIPCGPACANLSMASKPALIDATQLSLTSKKS